MKILLKKSVLFILIIMITASCIIPVFAAENPKNNIKIILDGEYLDFEIPPFIENGYVFVPFKIIFESFGLDVYYNEKTGDIYATLQTSKNSLQYIIDLKEKTLTGDCIEYDADTLIESKTEYIPIGAVLFQKSIEIRNINGQIFVHAKIIAESLGCKVNWDEKTKTVIINSANAVIIGEKHGSLTPKVTLDRSGLIETKSAKFKDTEDELVQLVNKARISEGMYALEQNEFLTKLARIKAQEMAENRLDKLEFSSGVKTFLKDNSVDALSHVCYYSIGKKKPAEIVGEWRKRASFDNDIYAVNKTTQVGIGGAKATDGSMYYVYIAIKAFGDKEKTDIENEFIKLLNDERVKQGLNPIAKNDDLMILARMKAKDMSDKDYFAHYSPIYGYPGDMMRKYTDNIIFMGENIVAGTQTANDTFNAWMKSTEHKAIMMDKNATIMGIGVSMDAKGNFRWSMITAKK
jgi:uncharacterized protein YkwD